jgi:hypothetical protein
MSGSTGPMLESRVMAQLRSLPPGQGRTAGQIAAGMAPGPDVSPASVLRVLESFRTSQPALAEREPVAGSRDVLWRLA